jgi:phage terminase large subunit-like protein
MNNERLLSFIKEQLSVPDGRPLAETLPADPWLEHDVFRPILATDDAGLPLHRQVYVELARAHAKTSSCGMVAVAYALDSPLTEVLGLAADLDQARLLTESIEGQRRRNPALARALRPRRWGFEATNGSKIRVLSSDAPSAYGLGVNCKKLIVILDELTQWSSRDLYDAMATTLPKVHNSQLIVITNAGVGPGRSWQWDVREGIRTHGYFYTHGGTLASWIRPEDLARVEASVPAAIYARFYLNQWTQEIDTFVDISWFDACADPSLPPLDDRTFTVVALDAAISNDCFAIVAATRAPASPQDSVAIRACRIWKPEPIIDFEEPRAWLADFCSHHNVYSCVYDNWQLHYFAERFRQEHGVNMDAFSQMSDRSVADTQLLQLLRDKRLVHPGGVAMAGLREHIGNAGLEVGLREDTKGRLCKRSHNLKIDAAVAASMASYEILRLWL